MTIVDTAVPPNLDLCVVVPIPQMHKVGFSGGSLLAEMANPQVGKATAERGIWSVVVPALLEEIRAARSSVISLTAVV